MCWIHAGGHINPAVSFGMLLAGKISVIRCVAYIIFQVRSQGNIHCLEEQGFVTSSVRLCFTRFPAPSNQKKGLGPPFECLPFEITEHSLIHGDGRPAKDALNRHIRLMLCSVLELRSDQSF